MMNERIKQLMTQATEVFEPNDPDYRHEIFDKEKFAQLIVAECVDCLKPLSRNHSMVGAAQDTIKKHFGVDK